MLLCLRLCTCLSQSTLWCVSGPVASSWMIFTLIPSALISSLHTGQMTKQMHAHSGRQDNDIWPLISCCQRVSWQGDSSFQNVSFQNILSSSPRREVSGVFCADNEADKRTSSPARSAIRRARQCRAGGEVLTLLLAGGLAGFRPSSSRYERMAKSDIIVPKLHWRERAGGGTLTPWSPRPSRATARPGDSVSQGLDPPTARLLASIWAPELNIS